MFRCVLYKNSRFLICFGAFWWEDRCGMEVQGARSKLARRVHTWPIFPVVAAAAAVLLLHQFPPLLLCSPHFVTMH